MAQAGRVRSRGTLARRFGVSRRTGLAVCCVALVALACLLGIVLGAPSAGVEVRRASPVGEEGGSPADAGEDAGEADAAPAQAPVIVHVDGAVSAPGVYELAEGDRVRDAVEAAGGLAEGADTSQMNLAATVADGEKVHVPVVGETVAAPPGGTGSAGAVPGPVNINTADVEELDTLPGVGEATAQAIVEDRERNGPFASPEDLMRVSGIGERKFERLEGLVCV